MPIELWNPKVPFILLCDVWNVLRYAYELQALSHGILDPYTEERNVV